MKIRLICFLACMASLLLLNAPAEAAPQIAVKTEYYEVYGESESEIREYLEDNYLPGEDGEQATALTKSSVGWKIDMLPEDNYCRITSAEVSVRITFILPRLEDRELMGPDLRRKWETFMRAIQEHERGHHDITVRSAGKLERMLLGIAPEASCDELKAKTDEIGSRIIQEAQEINNTYDADTRHGAVEGVVF